MKIPQNLVNKTLNPFCFVALKGFASGKECFQKSEFSNRHAIFYNWDKPRPFGIIFNSIHNGKLY